MIEIIKIGSLVEYNNYSQIVYKEDDYEIILNKMRINNNLEGHDHLSAQFGFCFSGKFELSTPEIKALLIKESSYYLASGYPHKAVFLSDIVALDFKFLLHQNDKKRFIYNALEMNEHGIFEFAKENYLIQYIKDKKSKIKLLDDNYIIVSNSSCINIDAYSFNLDRENIYQFKYLFDKRNITVQSSEPIIIISIANRG